MSIPISADQIIISAEEPDVLNAIIRLVLAACVDQVITVTTRQLDSTQLKVLAPDAGRDPDHLYGAAFTDDPRQEPAVGLPVIPIGDLAHIHIW